MFDSYNFAVGGNDALNKVELPQLTPDEIHDAQMRIKKLADMNDFQIRWGLNNQGRKDSEAKEMRYREASAESNFESGKQFAKFEKDFEAFIHPE